MALQDGSANIRMFLSQVKNRHSASNEIDYERSDETETNSFD